MQISAIVLGICIAARFVWVFSYAAVARLKVRWAGAGRWPGTAKPTARGSLVSSWCGMRGIVTLAAALGAGLMYGYRTGDTFEAAMFPEEYGLPAGTELEVVRIGPLRGSAKEQKRAEAEARKAEAKAKREREKRVQELEMHIATLEGQQMELAIELEDPAVYEAGGRAVAINRELSAVSAELERLTAEWEKATAPLTPG